VGFASAVHYLHPDKPSPEMWINEVGVSPEYQGRGLAKAILDALFGVARGLGCREAWVLTECDNTAAIRLCQSQGGTEADDAPIMFTFRLDLT
jgi:ribosomal protein S18 acetylase RimI-like enzyme